MNSRYQLDFISDSNLLHHVTQTIRKYKFQLDEAALMHNLIDPIKLTFDSHIYNLSMQQLIANESLRQIDKSNTNHIGTFHQNIFPYFHQAWILPLQGFDLIHTERHIYVEMKNKYNTMNAASSQRTYAKMQQKILEDDNATCYLVEVISKKSQNIPWRISLDGKTQSHKKIRRISIDQFYELVTGNPIAFYQLCQVLPQVIADALDSVEFRTAKRDLTMPHQGVSSLKMLYQLSFQHYQGFNPDLFSGDQ